jgi:hypothetical protein
MNEIEMDISTLEGQGIDFLNLLTDNKRKELRIQMIKFLKQAYWQNSLEYGLLLEFINDFFMENP